MGNVYTDSQKRASAKYLTEKVDEIKLRVPKGTKDAIKAHADRYDGGSVNAFIQRAIAETMKRDAEREQSPD